MRVKKVRFACSNPRIASYGDSTNMRHNSKIAMIGIGHVDAATVFALVL
jgi:hypothetical protein